MAFFFCLGYTIILLPSSILLLRPAAKLPFLPDSETQIAHHGLNKIPWPVWTSAALYCLPMLFAVFILFNEIAARQSTGEQGPFVDLFALSLLTVAIGLLRRSRIARVFALWLPMCCFLMAIFINRGLEYFRSGEITFVDTYESMMVRGFLVLTSFIIAPAILFLNLPKARSTFNPVNAVPAEMPADT